MDYQFVLVAYLVLFVLKAEELENKPSSRFDVYREPAVGVREDASGGTAHKDVGSGDGDVHIVEHDTRHGHLLCLGRCLIALGGDQG